MIMPKATGPEYRVPFRRRRKRLTDYRKRLGLVKSGLPRMVVRKTGKRVIVQFVEFDPMGDKVVAYADSNMLRKYEWPSRRNAPTAYLTGLLCGGMAKKKKVSKFVLDMGLQTASKGNIVFAAVKGALDSGLQSELNEDIVAEDTISGKHIAAYAQALKEKPEEYGKIFSAYKKQGIQPENIEELFTKVRDKIKEDVV